MCIFISHIKLSTNVRLFTVKFFCFILIILVAIIPLLFCLQPIAVAKIRKEFLTDPSFDMNHMRKAAAATGKLCKWVMAIEAYDRMVKGSGGTVEVSK